MALPEEQPSPDAARKRARWKAHQGRIDPSRLVFIDETWIKTNMAPLRGWGPRPCAAWPLEDDDLPGRAAQGPDRRTMGARWANQQRGLQDLCQKRASQNPETGRHRRSG